MLAAFFLCAWLPQGGAAVAAAVHQLPCTIAQGQCCFGQELNRHAPVIESRNSAYQSARICVSE